MYGTADVNSGDIPGGSGCKAMQIGTDAGNYLAGATQIYSGASGGHCGASGSSTCPTVTNYSPALADPYANLPALAGVPAGACTGSNPSPVGNAYPPGVYPLALNVPATATFSGTYIFCAGLSFTNGARVTGTNVLFYFKGGSLSEGGDSRVSLAAATVRRLPGPGRVGACIGYHFDQHLQRRTVRAQRARSTRPTRQLRSPAARSPRP